VLPPPVPLLVPLRLQPRHLSNQLGRLQDQRLQAAQQYHAGGCLGAAVQVKQQQLAQLQPTLFLLCSSRKLGATVTVTVSVGAACAAPAVEQQPQRAVARLAALADVAHLQGRLPVLVQAVGRRARAAALPSRRLPLLPLLQGAAWVTRQPCLSPCGCICPRLRRRLPRPLLLLLLPPALLLDLPRLCHNIRSQGWVAAKGQGKHSLRAVVRHRACRAQQAQQTRQRSHFKEEEEEEMSWQPEAAGPH
jgi:hypothetical protein